MSANGLLGARVVTVTRRWTETEKKNTGRTVFVSCVGERAIRDIVEELERERYELRSVLLGGCHDFSFGLPRPRALPVTTALRDARANPRSKMVTASAVVK